MHQLIKSCSKFKSITCYFFISFPVFSHQFGNYEDLLHVNLLLMKREKLFNFMCTEIYLCKKSLEILQVICLFIFCLFCIGPDFFNNLADTRWFGRILSFGSFQIFSQVLLQLKVLLLLLRLRCCLNPLITPTYIEPVRPKILQVTG